MSGKKKGKSAKGSKSRGGPPSRSGPGPGGAKPAWFGFGKANQALLAAAVAVIAVGYVLLDRGSITAAPMLLTLGYVVLVPAGLMLGYRKLGQGDEG